MHQCLQRIWGQKFVGFIPEVQPGAVLTCPLSSGSRLIISNQDSGSSLKLADISIPLPIPIHTHLWGQPRPYTSFPMARWLWCYLVTLKSWMKRTSNRSARPHLLQVSYFSIHPSPPLPPSLSLSHTHSHTFQLSLRKAVNVSMLRSPWSKFPGAYHHGRLLSSGMVTTGHQPDYISWVTLTSSKATGSNDLVFSCWHPTPTLSALKQSKTLILSQI